MKNNPSPATMFALIAGRWVSHILYAAARLELADHLKHGPRTVEDLAAAANVRAPELYRILRALASVGVFAEIKGKRFKLTPLGTMLQKAVPNSMRAMAIMAGDKYREESWEQLIPALQTGEIPFVKAHGVDLFEYLEKHPEDRETFGQSMSGISLTENSAIAGAYKFPQPKTLVDVGGGHGSLLAALLHANPKLRGVLFDRPSVIAGAAQDKHLTAKDISARCTLESGSFFDAVPAGGDAYIMKRVLHDWSDEECVKILANCRAAMNKNGKVLVADSVLRPGNQPDRGKILDVLMLTIGGRERTKEEFAVLFRKAGLKLRRVVPTQCPLSIVEGVRA